MALIALAACERSRPLVVDEAGLFAVEEQERLALFHGLLLTDHDIDYRVVTVASAADLNGLAREQFTALETGALSRNGFGLLLLIDTVGRKVRMEVGFGLEGYFPDAFVAYVEQRQMVPFFTADRVVDGILATTELIVGRAQRYALGETATAESWLTGTGGGGATARTDSYHPPHTTAGEPQKSAGQTPEITLAGYFETMARRDANPELDLYSPETRIMLRDWVMTPAQMDNLVATYRSCHPQAARFDGTGELAVIRYPVAQRKCAPWFFRRTDDAWQLDLTLMSRALRFGRDNSWHFEPDVEHPYAFAFRDWQFDRHGFPIAPQ
jgi:hypothetical protein